MNQIMANIKGRRSRRHFLARSIPEEIIREIIEAGSYAPSGLNKQPWKFIVITDRDCIQNLSSTVKAITAKIAKYLPILKLFKPELKDPQIVGAVKKTIAGGSDTVFYEAPLLILIASDEKEAFAGRDCALAAQNMMLYAHSLGIGSCFIGRADLLMRSKAAKDVMGLPPRHKLQAAVVFGYAPEEGKGAAAPARHKDNIINWVS